MEQTKKKINLLAAAVVIVIVAVGGNITYQANKITDIAAARIIDRDRQFDHVLANQKLILDRCEIKPRT